MALIKCAECGKEVSESAAFCPNCGSPSTRETEYQRMVQDNARIKNIKNAMFVGFLLAVIVYINTPMWDFYSRLVFSLIGFGVCAFAYILTSRYRFQHGNPKWFK